MAADMVSFFCGREGREDKKRSLERAVKSDIGSRPGKKAAAIWGREKNLPLFLFLPPPKREACIFSLSLSYASLVPSHGLPPISASIDSSDQILSLRLVLEKKTAVDFLKSGGGKKTRAPNKKKHVGVV